MKQLTVKYKSGYGSKEPTEEELEIFLDGRIGLQSLGDEGGALEEVERKVDRTVIFISNFIRLLYNKGILSPTDLEKLLSEGEFGWDIKILEIKEGKE